MDSPHYTSGLSFWIATIFVIIVTVFAVILRGAGPAMADVSQISGSLLGLPFFLVVV